MDILATAVQPKAITPGANPQPPAPQVTIPEPGRLGTRASR